MLKPHTLAMHTKKVYPFFAVQFAMISQKKRQAKLHFQEEYMYIIEPVKNDVNLA